MAPTAFLHLLVRYGVVWELRVLIEMSLDIHPGVCTSPDFFWSIRAWPLTSCPVDLALIQHKNDLACIQAVTAVVRYVCIVISTVT